MPITSNLADLMSGVVLPETARAVADLRAALAGRRILSTDEGFARSLADAFDRSRVSERQAEWIERLWLRYCDPGTALPADVLAGLAAVHLHARTLDPERARFAADMVTAVRGRLPSAAQWHAFNRLTEEAETAAARAAAPAPAPAPTVAGLDADRLFAMFDAAARAPIEGRTRRTPRLQFPGLNIWRPTTGADRDVIMLTRPHSDPARRTRLARLTRQGELLGGFSSRNSLLTTEQTDMVRRLCENPEETLRAEGRRTGTCCMCGRGLTDERSVNLGMGPVCASRWGLSAAWLSAAGIGGATTGRFQAGPRAQVILDESHLLRTAAPALSVDSWANSVLAETNLADVETRFAALARDPLLPAPVPVAERPEGWMRPRNAPDQEDF